MKLVKIFTFLLALTISITPYAAAQDDVFSEDSPVSDMEGGEYMGETGAVSVEDDIGGGQMISEDGSFSELDDAGGGESTDLGGTPLIMND